MAEEFLNKAGLRANIEKIKALFARKATSLSGYGITDAYTKTETDTLLGDKVSKVAGKGLSANDFTDTLKSKLDNIAQGAEANVQADWSQSSSSEEDFIKNKPALGTAAAKDFTATVREDDADLVTSGGVASAIKTASDALSARVSANETAIDTLNGEGAGSVKKTVADEIARVVDDAPEDFDTLKEISDWISAHPEDTAAMNAQIQANKGAIETLNGSDTTAGSVAKQVKDASDGLQSQIDTNASDIAGNATAIGALQALVPSTASATNKLVTEQGFTKTQLTNEDLNEILTQGYYYTNGADSVTNKPADNLANWELEVSAFGGRVIQIFTCGNSIYNAPTSGIVFYRVYGISGLAWSEWRQLATDSDLASLQSDISDNATAISTLDTTVAGLRTIRNLDTSHSAEQGKDLNDFKGESNTITTYWFRYASGFSNIPTPTFGSFDWLLLTVENASNRVQQTALLQKANNQAERWTRAFVYADVSGKTEWSSWKKLITDDDSLPVKIVNLRGTAAEPTDLNSVASNYQNMLVSVYYGEAGSVVNTPVTSHCAVFQFRHVSNPNYLTQLCFPVSSNKMYIRFCANGTWHDWVDIATDKLFIENWVNPDTDYFTAVNGIAVASVNPGRLPSIGVPGNDYSTYATFIALGGSNYKTALYIDVFGNLATWGSNQKQWYNIQKQITSGSFTIAVTANERKEITASSITGGTLPTSLNSCSYLAAGFSDAIAPAHIVYDNGRLYIFCSSTNARVTVKWWQFP